jgi:prepilin-type N-terminal cleavage/methylation domain-containing protein
MKSATRRLSRNGFMLMEVILALMIFAVIATAYTKAMSSVWRNSTFVKDELVIAQILDSELTKTLYYPELQAGSTERYVPERDMNVETQIVELEMENEEGRLLSQMWEVIVIGRYLQDGMTQERVVRGWRYLPLYRP